MELARLKHMPAIKIVMTPFPYAIGVDDPVSEAETQMREHGVRHLPVSDGKELVGIVTDRDIARHVNAALTDQDRHRITVGQICTMGAYVVDASTPLDEVLTHLAEQHIGSAIVVKEVGDSRKLVGILTLSDVCKILAGVLRDQFDDGDDDVA